jgi:YCII-related domain
VKSCAEMKRYLLLYNGPPPPPGASHEGWWAWFAKTGDAVVEVGSPMKNGVVVHGDGSASDDPSPLRGYGIVQAEDRDKVLEMVRDHPLFRAGSEYTIEVFELPKR